jgi:DNA-directed RNA polymerase subunit K/omega
VAAKYARELNALPRETMPTGIGKKLTTRAVETLAAGGIEFRLIARRKAGG